MPRGRPRTRPIEETPEGAVKPVRRRGPARKTVAAAPDTFSETKSLVVAILKSRGERGATSDTLQNVIGWARAVRAETEAIRELSTRQRRPKTGAEPERSVKNELNRALLEGVLDGSITLDVADDGSFSFTD